VIDKGDPPGRNIIIPVTSTTNLFLTDNFVCRICSLVSVGAEIEVKTFGFATGINFRCNCGSHCSIRPELLLSSLGKVENNKPGKVHSTQVNLSDFEINQRLLVVKSGLSSKDGES
jgi:hypothetical protein